MKAYIDNCIVSAIAKNEFPDEIDAFKHLLCYSKAGKVELVTSSITDKEIELYKGKNLKVDMHNLTNYLKQVPFIDDHTVLDFHSQWDRFGGASYPLVEDNTLSSSLRKILPKKRKNRFDAHHLMIAINAHCDVFLTVDIKTILKKARQIESQFPIRLMRPTELFNELSMSQKNVIRD